MAVRFHQYFQVLKWIETFIQWLYCHLWAQQSPTRSYTVLNIQHKWRTPSHSPWKSLCEGYLLDTKRRPVDCCHKHGEKRQGPEGILGGQHPRAQPLRLWNNRKMPTSFLRWNNRTTPHRQKYSKRRATFKRHAIYRCNGCWRKLKKDQHILWEACWRQRQERNYLLRLINTKSLGTLWDLWNCGPTEMTGFKSYQMHSY